MKRIILIGILLFVGGILSAQPLKVVKVSGKIVTGSANDSVPYVNIIITNKHIGTISNEHGCFTFTASVGDTLLFSSMGFQSAKVVVPQTTTDYYIEQHMVLDTSFLQEILIFPWDNYYAFKQDVLHTYPPKNDEDRAKENFKRMEELLLYDSDDAIPNASAAYNISLQKMKDNLYYRGQIRTISLLNPIAWVQFFKALNDGSLKNPNKK